jgi:hypothetical protein
MKADRDLTFYGIFVKESVYDSITSYEYFKEVEDKYEKADISGTNVWDITNGVSLSPAKKLRGKITIPVVSKDGKPVVSLRDFSNSNGKEITHIFFAKNGSNEVRKILGNCFLQNTNLVYVNFNQLEKLRVIYEDAFRECKNMTNVFFGKSLAQIKTGAFNQYHSNGTLDLSFTGALTSIDKQTFNNCGDFGTLSIGGPEDQSLLKWPNGNDGRAFINSNMRNDVFSKITVYCEKNREGDFITALKEGEPLLAQSVDVEIIITN